MLDRRRDLCVWLVGLLLLQTWGAIAWAQSEEALPLQADRDVIRVAIYDHSDGSAKGPTTLRKVLTPERGFECVKVTPEDVQQEGLREVDVLIMPGGSGSLQSKRLGEAGREKVRQFVRGGKGYVGICAGAYLATSYYDWSLHLINADVIDREHWARGTGKVVLKMKDAGRGALAEAKAEIEVYYGQGPLLGPGSAPELPEMEILAVYGTEIAKKGAPTGVMVGTCAIARAPFAAGRVVCFSPHPEVSGGPNHLVVEAVRWAAGKAPASAQAPLDLQAAER